MDAEPPVLNAVLAPTFQAAVITKPIFETLINYNEKFEIVPGLAQTWKLSDDAMTLTFDLAAGATFHDGKPVTSDDVAFTFEYARANNGSVKSVFANLTTVDTSNPQVAVLRFSKPSATALSLVGDALLNVLPRHVYGIAGDVQANPANNAPIGSGPYKFVSWDRGQKTTFDRNPTYWNTGLPHSERVVFSFIPDNSQAAVAVERGDADYFPQLLSMADGQRLKSNPAVTIVPYSVAGDVIVAAFNLRRQPFSDLKVRQALSLAVDRQRMLDQIGLGFGAIGQGLVANTIPRYADTSLPVLTRDVAEANRQLDAAGLTKGADGFRAHLTIHVTASIKAYAQTAEVLRENLADVGIDATVRAIESASYIDTVFKNSQFDIAIFGAFSGPEPDRRLFQWYSSQNITGAPFSNAMDYKNAEVDALIGQASSVVDPTARKAVYSDIQKKVLADMPVIPLWEPQYLSVFRSEWKDLMPYADARYNGLYLAHR